MPDTSTTTPALDTVDKKTEPPKGNHAAYIPDHDCVNKDSDPLADGLKQYLELKDKLGTDDAVLKFLQAQEGLAKLNPKPDKSLTSKELDKAQELTKSNAADATLTVRIRPSLTIGFPLTLARILASSPYLLQMYRPGLEQNISPQIHGMSPPDLLSMLKEVFILHIHSLTIKLAML